MWSRLCGWQRLLPVRPEPPLPPQASRRDMRRERRQPTRSEWERISSSRPVVRRILCPGARDQTPQTSSGTQGDAEMRMCQIHTQLSEERRAKAEALLEDQGEGG